MKIFLSGPITGIPEYAQAFKYVEKLLLEKDFNVMNPAILPPSGFSHEDYMTITLSMQKICDATFMLPGWEDSEGCVQEVAAANELRQPIFYTIDNLVKFRERKSL